jgi:phospholipid/cholesterol/gamma-HCH transport system substrate-binding protein
MEQKTGNNIKLGIFVTISIVLFIAAIYIMGKKQLLFGNTFQVSGVFKDVNGLQIGNNVRFSGINVGIVKDIQLVTDSTVRVDMTIDENTRKYMKKNSKAIIGSDGLMGGKILLIIPGSASNDLIANNDTIATAQPVNMEDIMVKLKVTSDNAAAITGDLAAIIHNVRSGNGTVGKLFMDNRFAGNLDKTLVNFKEGTGGFKQNMDAASQSFLLKGYLKKKKRKEKKRVRQEEKAEKKRLKLQEKEAK